MENTCKALRTQKTVQFLNQAEPGYWMVMVSWLQSIKQRRLSMHIFLQSIHAPSERRTDGPPENSEYTEYKGDQVHEQIYGNLLKQSYHLFRMFGNTFESNASELTDGVPRCLIGKLNEFYTKVRNHKTLLSRTLKLILLYSQYVSTLKLNSCDILTVFRSLHYVPLEQALFLRVHNFIEQIKSTFPSIRHCLLMHDEQMVW